jgi:hypothetical protein
VEEENMYSKLVLHSVWDTSLLWWLLWVGMAALVWFIINRSVKGSG